MAAPSAITFYDAFKKELGDGTLDMNTNPIYACLVTGTYTPSAAHSVYADLTNEVANGNGYTTGGVALTGLTFNQTAGVATWTSSNPAWTSSGAGFTARRLVFYVNSTVNGVVKPLIGHMLLDSAPADVVWSGTNTITVTINASGWFTLT